MERKTYKKLDIDEQIIFSDEIITYVLRSTWLNFLFVLAA